MKSVLKKEEDFYGLDYSSRMGDAQVKSVSPQAQPAGLQKGASDARPEAYVHEGLLVGSIPRAQSRAA